MASSPSTASSSADKEKHLIRADTTTIYDLNGEDIAHARTKAAVWPDAGQELQGDVEKGEPIEEQEGPPPRAFDARENPDGGSEAWLCVVGGFCCLFCSFGWINSIGVFQNYYQSHLLKEYSPSTVSWISSFEVFFMFLCGPVIGKLYDNYGPRWILLGGTFLHVFGLMMTSLATEYYQFILAQGICSPIGASAIFYPAVSAVPTWFFEKRAFAFGLISAGSSVGGVIYPIMVQRLIVEVGFGWAMRIAAFLILALMVVANLTVKSRMPPLPRPWSVLEFLRPLKEVTYDLIAFGGFLFSIGLFLPINYIILEATSYGMSASLAQYLVSILNAASLFGRTIPGYIADKIGRFNMMVVMTSFAGILVLAMWLPATGNAPIIVFAALYGFGSGAYVSLTPSLIAQISDVRQIGVRTGTLFAVVAIAGLISNPIGGALITKWKGNFTGLKIFCGIMCLGGAAFMAFARIRLAGIKLTAKV